MHDDRTETRLVRRFQLNTSAITIAIVASVSLIGLMIRLYDLTDPPLDFHETRQLGSAVIARGMYYSYLSPDIGIERTRAIELWDSAPVYEPPILERIVATTYLLVGNEYLWIARLYSSLAWVLGGIGLFILARDISSSAGAIGALLIFMFLPYGIIASRSFQPDPLMVSFVIFSALALYRWGVSSTWRLTIIAGVVCGIAILLKAVAVFPVMGAFLGITITTREFKKIVTDKKVFSILILSITPVLAYHLFFIPDRASGLFSFWVLSFRELLFDPSFYISWLKQINFVIGFEIFVFGLLGVVLFRKRNVLGLVFGLLVGYVLYGFALPYQIMTHDYYHLMLIPIIAMCLSPIAGLVLESSAKSSVARIATALILLFAVSAQVWNVRADLDRRDYRAEIKGWKQLGELLPESGEFIALTHSYGFRLRYYSWVDAQVWPYQIDLRVMQLSGAGDFDFLNEFNARTVSSDFFLITHFSEFDQQPELKQILQSRYPVLDEGDGYLLFDLTQEIQ